MSERRKGIVTARKRLSDLESRRGVRSRHSLLESKSRIPVLEDNGDPSAMTLVGKRELAGNTRELTRKISMFLVFFS